MARGGAIGLSIHRGLSCFVADWLTFKRSGRCKLGEFELPKKKWTIPAARMKGRPGKARPHLVPLTDNMLEILHSLPRFKHGDYLFSSTLGAKSIWISSTVKGVLDAHMRRTLRALARRRGDDLVGCEPLPRWTNRDIRRSVRSQLSSLKCPDV